MAGLLVSVRSAEEAHDSLRGGADVIDVKEPRHGPLGRAGSNVWNEVRAVVPRAVPMSLALGELVEWRGAAIAHDLAEVAYVKMGLAGTPRDWTSRWDDVRASLGDRVNWVAVAYADWITANAPAPGSVIEHAIDSGCAGVLIDTYDKSRTTRIEVALPWTGWIGQARSAGLFVALAGGLRPDDLIRLSPLQPDLFAVRGAVCRQQDRLRSIDPVRVTHLRGLLTGTMSSANDPPGWQLIHTSS